MFPQPKRVHSGQPGLFVGSGIPGVEAVEVGRTDPTLLPRDVLLQRRQQGLADVQVRIPQLTYI